MNTSSLNSNFCLGSPSRLCEFTITSESNLDIQNILSYIKQQSISNIILLIHYYNI
nr:MAG TPA: hypothetical protein [Caudoviricetes sp.]